MICFKCWAHHFVSAAITAADNCQMRRDGDKQLLPLFTTVTRTLSQPVDSPPLLYNHSVLILQPSAANSSADAGSPTLKFRKICFNTTNDEWSQITSIWTKKKTRKQTNNNSLATAAGWQRFQFHTSHTSVLPSFSRKRQFQDSVTNQLPFSRSEQLLQAGLPWKKENTGGDQEETEPGRQQPRTMKPIRPRWEQTPPTFEPVKCKELRRKISWLVAKMAGNSKQLEGEYVSVDACLSLCGPVVNFPRV